MSIYATVLIYIIMLLELNSLEGKKTSSFELSVPPEDLKEPLYTPHKLMMGIGPVNAYPRDLKAGSRPAVGHMHKEFYKIMDDVKSGLKYLFQTKNKWTIVISGPGHLALETLIHNLLQPGETILVGVNGLWGERVVDLGNRLGIVTKKLEGGKLGTAFNLKQIEEGLKRHKPEVLYLIHGETTTGVLQPLEGVGDLCRRYGSLLVVDVVASVGAVPVYMDAWKIDAIYTGSQKVISAPPGLAPISFGSRAIAKIKSRTTPIRSFLLDMNLLCDYWDCAESGSTNRTYHHAPPVNTIYTLRESLAIMSEEGLLSLWKRHAENCQRFHAGIKELGLEFFTPDPLIRMPHINVLKIPKDINGNDVINYAMDNYLVEIGAGLGPTLGKVFRIGVMGFNAKPKKVDKVLKVLGEGLDYAKQQSKT